MKTLLSLLILLVIILTATYQSTTYNDKELKVVFRYDDYSKYSNLALESELFELVKSKGGGILVGVIPYPYEPHPVKGTSFNKKVFLNNEKINLLKKYHASDTIEIAAHGFDHKNNALLDYRSEFAGLPVPEQQQLLHIVSKELESALGFKVTSFVPPFNTLDRNTLTALKNEGYTLLSAASSNPLYQAGDINYLPGGPYPNKLRAVIDSAISKNHYDALIISTQHPYDIKESGEKMPEFRKNKAQVSLADIKDDLNYIDKIENIQFTSLSKLYKANENLSAERLLANMQLKDSFVTKHKLLPGILELYPASGLYYSLEAANDMYIKQIILTSLLYLIVLILTALISRYLLYLFANRLWLSAVLAIIAFFLLVVALAKIYFSGFYFLAATIITIAIGLGLSISISPKTKPDEA